MKEYAEEIRDEIVKLDDAAEVELKGNSGRANLC